MNAPEPINSSENFDRILRDLENGPAVIYDVRCEIITAMEKIVGHPMNHDIANPIFREAFVDLREIKPDTDMNNLQMLQRNLSWVVRIWKARAELSRIAYDLGGPFDFAVMQAEQYLAELFINLNAKSHYDN